jgi:hypothetical protein
MSVDAQRRALLESESFQKELEQIQWRREVMALPHGGAYILKLWHLSEGSMTIFKALTGGVPPAWVASKEPVPKSALIWLEHGVGPNHPCWD